jgi:NMD protein affecting ribosome stability and mRNA decay
MHPKLIAGLANDRRKCCPCGASTDEPHGLCRTCLVRLGRRRCTSRPSRGAVRRRAGRRRAGRQARGPAWIFAVAASRFRTIGKGAKS